MRERLSVLLDRLRTGFWFVPSMMIVLAIGLALWMLWLDERVDPGINASLPWAYSGGPEGARSLLSTIAGSMITAASVTFSLASVAISIASQQYGSRVLRNFMRDRVTQFLLGTFVSTFVYSVLVVRSIRGSEFSGGFVPAISVTVAIVLSVASLVLLVYFVHHVSTSIQASHIVSVIAQDLEKAVPILYPEMKKESSRDGRERSGIRNLPTTRISKEEAGYVRSVDLDGLVEIAKRCAVVIEILVKPGDHCLPFEELAVVRGASVLSEEDQQQCADAFVIGSERSALQDIRFQFQQLTDVTVRALSPGINDPFTAINAIDALAGAVFQLARSPRPLEERNDESGALRLIVATPRLEEVLHDTVGHIALYAAPDPFVMAALRRVLSTVEPKLNGDREHAAYRGLMTRLDTLERNAANQKVREA